VLSVTIQRARRLGLGLSLPVLDVRALGVLVVYMIFAAVSFLGFTDPDFWWHLRTGQLIADTGSIPKADPFSFTAAGSRWIAHEWLSDLLIYKTESAVGYWGNVILFSALALAAILIMHRLLLRMGVSPRVALGLAVLGGTISLPYWTVRPQAFSWLFAAIFLYTLYLRRTDPRTKLWHLPPLMLLWANLHAGYVIGLLLLGLWLAATAAEQVLWRERHDLRGPALVFIACFAATAVNPNGLALLTYPLTYLAPGNASQTFITEWQSPNFHSPVHWPLAIGIVALALVGLRTQGRNLFGLGLAVVFTLMALLSSRHQPLFALVFMAVMGDALRQQWRWARHEDAARPVPRGPLALNWSILAVVILTLALLVERSPSLQLKSAPLTTGTLDYPVAGAEFIRDNYPDARVFNSYWWGGYLINELYPEQRVFIDGRPDMYGDAFVKQYIQVVRLEPGWRDVLTEYDVDLVITENDSPLAAVLVEAGDWSLAFSGPVEAVFVRADGAVSTESQ
jgi:hypothetical protein